VKDDRYRDIYWLLKGTTQSLKQELRKKLEEHGITWPQFHALYHISPGGIPANELARELSCNPSNLTGLIDRMIESGWVFREHSAEDRRVWLIKLTPAGQKMKDIIIPRHKKNIRERMAVLSDSELGQLEKLLLQLKNGKGEVEKDDERN